LLVVSSPLASPRGAGLCELCVWFVF
jgi:hypothetical protein